jgi:hypothetical protein
MSAAKSSEFLDNNFGDPGRHGEVSNYFSIATGIQKRATVLL